MGPGDERIDVNTSAAVRGDAGFHFGTLRWVQGERFVVEVDAELEPGDEVEVRITLQPVGTAFVRASVQRPLVTGKAEAPRWVMQTISIAPEDRARLAAWLHNARSRGTMSNFDAISTNTPVERPMGQNSTSEVKAALARLAQRSMGSAQTEESADPYGLKSDLSAPTGGRAAMRDALRKAVVKPGAPAPTPTVAPPAPRAPADAPWARAGQDPAYATTATRSASWLEVRWSSAEVFAKDARGLLVDPMLHLAPSGTPLPERDPIRVVLRHADLCVECDASVKAHGPYGGSYRLALGEGERAVFGAWLRANSR